jgi:hypothetical protein
MSTAKPSRRKTPKLEPIDWHEFANDAVLNGNMSTLYQRPASEDASAYASPEALREIEKRTRSGGPTLVMPSEPTVGPEADATKAPTVNTPTVGLDKQADAVGPTVGPISTQAVDLVPAETPTVGSAPTVGLELLPKSQPKPADSMLEPTVGPVPTVGLTPTVGASAESQSAPNALSTPTVGSEIPDISSAPTVGLAPPVGLKPARTKEKSPEPSKPTVGIEPTVGLDVEPIPELVVKGKIKPLRDVQDALTLAGQVLYKALYGAPDGARSKLCAKGYRQLASETHLDKDTVRDLIVEFKAKGMVREVATYDPDTRSAKSYDVLSDKAILQMWREAGLRYVTTGRKRPVFCTPEGEQQEFTPTVGTTVDPTVGPAPKPTVGPEGEFLHALEQITGSTVDPQAANQLILNCRAEATDCTLEEIMEFAWSKAFLCRSGKIANPIGFLTIQVPKHFQGEALLTYRDKKRQELEAAAALAVGQEE